MGRTFGVALELSANFLVKGPKYSSSPGHDMPK
jgi:hypothetical protein